LKKVTSGSIDDLRSGRLRQAVADGVPLGGTFVAARVVTQHVEPFSASFLRFVVASFFLILLAGKRKASFPLLKKISCCLPFSSG